MSQWPSARQRRPMNRNLRAVLYVAVAVGIALGAALGTAWLVSPRLANPVFIAVGLAAVAMAGALTPRRYAIKARKDAAQ